MSINSEYINDNANHAICQMEKYGIPASISLAQGILESASGQSQLAKEYNGHFGIKCTKDWLRKGGGYAFFNDDAPNEKFCTYPSVGDSYEHHSQFLINNKRYQSCFKLPADDYVGWAKALDKAGYATGDGYAEKLIHIIKVNHLDRYDRQVISKTQDETKKTSVSQKRSATPISPKTSSKEAENYALPLKRKEFMLVTSKFGNRKDPLGQGTQFHAGVDIQAKNEAVLSTEKGKVKSVNHATNTKGGKCVTLEFERPDGKKVEVTYCHLDSIQVKAGDVIKAGQSVGMTGNTGTHTTGEHLHISVKNIAADGNARQIDPACYVAEIAALGGISTQMLHNGTDLTTKYQSEAQQKVNALAAANNVGKENKLEGMDLSSPENWMKKLLSSEDAGMGMDGGDPLMALVMMVFTSLFTMAHKIDNESKEEKMQAATDAALNRVIPLSDHIKGYSGVQVRLLNNGQMELQAQSGKHMLSHQLTTEEVTRWSKVLSDDKLNDTEKMNRLSAMSLPILTGEAAKLSFEVSTQEQKEQSMGLWVK